MPSPSRRLRGYALRKRQRALAVDVKNVLLYGWHAPRYAQRVWIDPLACYEALVCYGMGRKETGSVRGGEWDEATVPLSGLPKISACERHWIDGVSWADSGIYDYMYSLVAATGRADGCEGLDDIRVRYKRVDEMFEQVRRERVLKSRRELGQENFRAWGKCTFMWGGDRD